MKLTFIQTNHVSHKGNMYVKSLKITILSDEPASIDDILKCAAAEATGFKLDKYKIKQSDGSFPYKWSMTYVV